ncbi:3-hydroxyanthranilate 3,4-dioxygenase, variant [Capsaspora owczarzaki ATCC 30864]|uniref:3-hydroxyanthranilate 3,4-dioxygenase, variant n=1 Tax=Capsaspora owczarzaki (strain ATCC 30864) TaxID=595528 RepID=A0A0D2U3I2_CAPO3|nr:3-hydroxyanthranilate 3,4-dioxygenase, variant [Capsaspora owczarzaki ATCC 30864]
MSLFFIGIVQFKVMVVAGPNTRTDYHLEDGEEWFYMVEGDMCLRVVDGGVFRDVVIREGESFMLPGNIPHSPQRLANTIGLVIERERDQTEIDHLRWYCPQCREIVHEGTFHCVDLGSQLKPVIEGYYASTESRTCSKCGTLDLHPSQRTPPAADPAGAAKKPGHNSINPDTHPNPFNLRQAIEAKGIAPGSSAFLYGPESQFHLKASRGPSTSVEFKAAANETWFYQLSGSCTVNVQVADKTESVQVDEGQCYLLPRGISHAVQRSADSLGLVLSRP